MNINTFRELFSEYLTAFAKKAKRGWIEKMINHAPVFRFGIPENVCGLESFKFAEGFVEQKLMLPFEALIILDSIKTVKGEDLGWFIYRDERLFINIFRISHSRESSLFMLISILEKDMLAARQNGEERSSVGAMGMIRPMPYIVYPENMELEAKQDALAVMTNALDSLSYFCSIVNSPGNFLVKVSPSNNAKKGRSVQWIESKSHYIILGREHGKMMMNNGTRDFNGTITRAMHNRRAHKRLLTSDRFRNKRGQSVWVKSSWVGPKEWEGTDKKVYRVMNFTPPNNP